MSFDVIKYILLIAYSFGGFLIAFYIHNKKKTGAPLVCPLRAKCHVVIHSEYSKFLNIPIEWMGMGYYLLLGLSYVLLLLFPALGHPTVFFVLVFMTACAFAFSLYLTSVQIFAIKQFCSWCLLSALLCFMIFSVTLVSPPMGIDIVMSFHFQFLLALHLVGIVLGLGGATLTDLFFFKFLKDFKVEAQEAEILNTFSQVIWIGIAILIITGLGLYLPQRDILNHSNPFMLKMTIVSVIFINGILLNTFIAPRTKNFSFVKILETDIITPVHIRQAAFALGAVSVSSWYTTLFLATMKKYLVGFEYWLLLALYLIIVLCAVIGSQILEKLMARGVKLISV